MIIKAQRPVGDSNLILIYNKDRSLYQQLESGPLMIALGDRYKAYFEADIDSQGLMHIKREVKASW